jgi:hypothetical protein
MWLYSLIFVIAVEALGRALIESVHWVHGHGMMPDLGMAELMSSEISPLR